MQSSNLYNIMPDGTVKQVNPFTGTEVWAVPGTEKQADHQRGPAHGQPARGPRPRGLLQLLPDPLF